jgi:hypothetical protein
MFKKILKGPGNIQLTVAQQGAGWGQGGTTSFLTEDEIVVVKEQVWTAEACLVV